MGDSRAVTRGGGKWFFSQAFKKFFPDCKTFFQEVGGAWGAPFTPGADPGRDGPGRLI